MKRKSSFGSTVLAVSIVVTAMIGIPPAIASQPPGTVGVWVGPLNPTQQQLSSIDGALQTGSQSAAGWTYLPYGSSLFIGAVFNQNGAGNAAYAAIPPRKPGSGG